MASNETMEMVTSYHNRYFYALIRVLTQLNTNQTITFQEFSRRMEQLLNTDKDAPKSEYSYEVIEKILTIACKNGILARNGDSVTKVMRNNVVPPLSMTEKVYLKNILQSPHAKLFLDEWTIQKIEVALSDVPDIPLSEIIDVKGIADEIDANREYSEDFKRMLTAIRKGMRTSSTNFAFDGHIYRDISLPLKMEFSITGRYFCNSAWSLKWNRTFRADMGRLANIKLLFPMKKVRWKVTEQEKERRKKYPLIMIVRDTDNAIEKINRFFTTYPKEIRRINDEIIWLSVQYPYFDENEIISNILSLGTAVQVISPEQAVEKIKEKLENRLSLN